MTKNIRVRQTAALLLALMLLASLLPPRRARAEDRIVRVGWYESPFNTTDELGRRSGYAYDYQQKLAAYTGWTYEYVQGSWPELLQMLIDGRIDLLSDVSYTEERADKMLFSALPMGAEEYYLFIAPGNTDISAEDFSSFSGKKVGANKGSVQMDYFRRWAETNGVEAELVELSGTEEENVMKLHRGLIDVYVSLDGLLDKSRVVPVCHIGASDFYFAVSNSRPELLAELNPAMLRVRNENQFFNQELYSKYLETTNINLYLSPEESAWLTDHGPIRVGYRDNYLAFCASDPETGELTGALKEYLRVAADCLHNTHLDFEPVAYPTAEDAMAALKNGEVDCVFPANLTDYDGELQGFFMTPALMRTDMSAVIRESDLDSFSKKERVAVAVNIGNPNYDMFLLDHFPEWRAIYFEDTPACLKAISEGQADCLLISRYRFNNIARLCEKYGLTIISTGVEMDDCFAVNRRDTVLYSILTKTTGAVPASTINGALTQFYTEDAKLSLMEMLKRNLSIVVGVLILVAAVIVSLLLRNVHIRRTAGEGRRLISETETDPLTGLYNREYFYAYAERMYRANPDRPMDAAALNIEHFRSLNSLNGQSFADRLLQTLGDGLSRYAQDTGGIAGRVGVDRFLLYCPPAVSSQELYRHLQGLVDTFSPNVSVRLFMGVMPWQADTEPAALFEAARTACSMARGGYEERLVVFDDKLREREALERRLLEGLESALERGEISVCYQPVFDIRHEPPALAGAEALVRWRHPELGALQPEDFIPLLERKGAVGQVDRFVWAEAARQIAAWRDRLGVLLPMSVNLSRLDVCDPGMEPGLDRLRDEYALAPGCLRLEIAESVISENEYRLGYVIERLRKKGYEIVLDNFGTGSSSLNMLSSIPVDTLKMDPSLVSCLEFDEKGPELARLTLDISEYLKVPVIAEGVETEGQLRILRELGCGFAQGFRFAPPLPPEEFEEQFLKSKA